MKTPHGGYIEWIPSATGKGRITEQEFIGKSDSGELEQSCCEMDGRSEKLGTL